MFMNLFLKMKICLFLFFVAQSTGNKFDIGLYFTKEHFDEIGPILDTHKNNVNFIERNLEEDDSFKSSKFFCDLLQKHPNLMAIFVSESKSSSPMIQSITAKLSLPFIQTTWIQYSSYLGRKNSLNFYPDFDLLSNGLSKIVESLQWKSFIILYEDFDSFLKLQHVLKLQNVIVKQLDSDKDVRSSLKEIGPLGERRIVLDCKTEHVINILKSAKEVGIMTYFYSYFITSLDAHTLDLKSLHADANITTVRIINPQDTYLTKLVEKWNHPQYPSPFSVKTGPLLLEESISVLIDAVSDVKNVTFNNVSCKSSEKFNYGPNIISYMNSHYTSRSNFDEEGKRMNFTLYLIEGNREKIIATWNSLNSDVVNFLRTAEESYKKRIETLQSRVQNVSMIIGEPYLMLKKDHDKYVGNERYEGYALDLIYSIAKKLKFQFNIQVSSTRGTYNEHTQSWDGMIGDILKDKVQFGLGELTITPERKSVVDFSMPYMRFGLGILLQKPKPQISMFAFLNPLNGEVWMYTATLYLTVTVIIYFVARMAPSDWENPHPCNLNPTELESIWSIRNCLWLTTGSIMNQGCDILPKSLSTRLVTSMWWLFALIMTNSYIASLAAFLTVKAEVIDDLEDLAKQNRIKYGCLHYGATHEFFRQSNYSTYRRMYANMILNEPSVFTNTTTEGIERVRNTPEGGYAFLMETSTLDYILERSCDFTTVDDWFNNMEYGIAMALDSTYRTIIDDAILDLQENGQLNELQKKWWETNHTDTCVNPPEGSELRLENIGGIFIVLGIGIAIALLLGIIEFLWTARQISIKNHLSYWEVFKIELLFALNVWNSKKKVKHDQTSNDTFVKSNELQQEQSEERQNG